MISAYEAEMNLVIHSVGGELRLEISHSMIHLFSKDDGPGIENVELAMKEDFSTVSRIWCRDGNTKYEKTGESF